MEKDKEERIRADSRFSAAGGLSASVQIHIVAALALLFAATEQNHETKDLTRPFNPRLIIIKVTFECSRGLGRGRFELTSRHKMLTSMLVQTTRRPSIALNCVATYAEHTMNSFDLLGILDLLKECFESILPSFLDRTLLHYLSL